MAEKNERKKKNQTPYDALHYRAQPAYSPDQGPWAFPYRILDRKCATKASIRQPVRRETPNVRAQGSVLHVGCHGHEGAVALVRVRGKLGDWGGVVPRDTDEFIALDVVAIRG
jgi:hypothetical protein